MEVLPVLLVFVFVGSSLQEQTFSDIIKISEALAEPIKAACLKETGADANLADRLLYQGEWIDNGPLKCYIKCLYVTEGAVNSEGEFIPEIAKQKLGVANEMILIELFNKCAHLSSEDICEKVFYKAKCIYKNLEAKLKP